jgi:hypothetical protein
MSIASMVDTHLAKQLGQDSSIASPSSPQGVPTSLTNQIARWIPTETIAIYVAVLALLAPATKPGSDYASRWVLFWIMVGVNPVVVLLVQMAKGSPPLTTPGYRLKLPLFAMAVSMVAFSAWAFALPDTPLGDISGYNTKWNIAIITIVTTAVTLIANAFHESPELDQVQTVAQGAAPAGAAPAGAAPAGAAPAGPAPAGPA